MLARLKRIAKRLVAMAIGLVVAVLFAEIVLSCALDADAVVQESVLPGPSFTARSKSRGSRSMITEGFRAGQFPLTWAAAFRGTIPKGRP